MSEIKLKLADWLYNAGIVGLVNILQHAREDVEFNRQEVTIKMKAFDNFEEKYFKYFIDTYEKTMIYSKLIGTIRKLISIEMDETKIKEVEKDIEFIKTKMKNSAYRDIVINMDFKKLDKPNRNRIDINVDFLRDLQEIIQKEKNSILRSECTGYYDQKSKKSKAPNAIIDKYINTNMLEINEFVDEVRNYVSENIQSDFCCFSCGRETQINGEGLSFLNRMFFDTERKSSHVWNFKSDIKICALCRFIYYCIPAGFTTIYGNGIFINENHSVQKLVNINYVVKHEILNNDESKGIYNAFGSMIRALQESINKNEKYEFADIQVVRYEEEKYRFNLLSKNVIKVLCESKDELNSLIKTGFQEVNTFFRLYDEVMKKLLNNENLFLLIHKTIVVKISKPKDAKYNDGHIKNLIKINTRFMEGVGYMESPEKDIIKSASGAGYYLKEAYKSKNSENKLNGISYKLLNALKTNNKNMFMDTVLNCYLYTDKMIPQFITDCLRDDNVFKTIGYAFVTGLIDGKKTETTNGGDK